VGRSPATEGAGCSASALSRRARAAAALSGEVPMGRSDHQGCGLCPRGSLAALQLSPWRLYGHEQGSKAEVRAAAWPEGGPVVHRSPAPTLETILFHAPWSRCRCPGAGGYLGQAIAPPGRGIALLEPTASPGPWRSGLDPLAYAATNLK